MERLIVKVCKIVYLITGAKTLSFIFALLYVTALNLVAIYGFGLLFEELVPFETPFNILFQAFGFPYVFGTSFVLLAVTFFFSPHISDIDENERVGTDNATLILYTGIAVLLVAYALIVGRQA